MNNRSAVPIYDHSPITSEELTILRTFVHSRKDGHSYERLLADLPRFVLPLQHAVEQLHYVPFHKNVNGEFWFAESKRAVIKGVTKGMLSLRKVFWSWSEEEWREVISGLPEKRLVVIAVAYKLCNSKPYRRFPKTIVLPRLYQIIFGDVAWRDAEGRVAETLTGWHYNVARDGNDSNRTRFTHTLACALLDSETAKLEDVTHEVLEAIRERGDFVDYALPISKALHHMGIVDKALPQVLTRTKSSATWDGMPDEWRELIEGWESTAVRSKSMKNSVRWAAQKTGRWLRATHPEITRPEDWTDDVAIDFLIAVDSMNVGDYVSSASTIKPAELGKPLTPRTKLSHIKHLSIFFKELQRKRLVGKLKIDPNVDLKVPSSISSLVGPDPRDIDDETWLKLTWASLNLTDEDLRTLRVPPALVRALAVLWTHGGLRFDEVRRLTVGCTRAVKSGTRFKTETLEGEVADYVGLLDVPVSKTASASTKQSHLSLRRRYWRGNKFGGITP